MTRFLAALALACALNGCHPVFAADPACDGQFLDGKRPVVTSPAGEGGVELCNDSFVTFWSPVTRDPVYSAEHLTPEGLTKADHEARDNGFHADARLPKVERVGKDDFGGACDRGHLAPAHDMPTPEAMHQSFLMSNMGCQVPSVNRGGWARVEIFVRRLAILGGGAWVNTALAFGAHPKTVGEGIAVPSFYVKGVYVPPGPFNPDGQVGAYAMANRDGAEIEVISLDEMVKRTGVDPFPSLSAEMHGRVGLPAVAGK